MQRANVPECFRETFFRYGVSCRKRRNRSLSTPQISVCLPRLMEDRATLAQLVERLIRNQQVSGSSPEGGSTQARF